MFLKKMISVLLVAMLTMSVFSLNSYANQSVLSKVGIAEDMSSHSVIKLDGNMGTALQTNIENTQVVNLGDSIGLFSSPWNPYYRLTHDSCVSAILNSQKLNLDEDERVTSEGYSLQYFDSNGIHDSSKTVEAGGWIEAVRDSETIKIPVVDFSELEFFDGSEIGKDWSNSPSGTYINRYAENMGGKISSDTCLQLNVDRETVISSSNPLRCDNRSIGSLNSPKSVITVEFDIRVTGDAVASVRRNNGYNIFKLSSDGILKYYSYDNQGNVEIDVCKDASLWHKIAFTYDYAGNRILYYFDGEILGCTGDLTFEDLTELRFGIDNGTYESGGSVCFDNLSVYRGYYKKSEQSPISVLCRQGTVSAQYNSKEAGNVLILALYEGCEMTDVTYKVIESPGICSVSLNYDSLKAYKAFVRKKDLLTPVEYLTGQTDDIQIGDNVILNCDFEKYVPLNCYANGSILEQTDESEENRAMLFERISDNDFHLTASGFNSQSDCMVMEFDLKVIEPSSKMNICIKDAKAVENCYIQLLSGGVLKLGNTWQTLNLNQWYRVSMMVNTYDRIIEYYTDGKLIAETEVDSGFAVDSGINLFRIHVPPSSAAEDNSVKFFADNIRIYEGTGLKDEVVETEKKIILTGQTVFPSDTNLKNNLKDYFAVHTKSGVAFANGNKTVLNDKPISDSGTDYVAANELASFYGLPNELNGYVTIDAFAKKYGLTLTKVVCEINSGLYILGKEKYTLPESEEEIKELNDYLFYLRPSPEDVAKNYALSSNKGVHPRLQATSSDFEGIRESTNSDSYMRTWKNSLLNLADKLLKTSPIKYELRDGQRLLYVSREALNNMYTLGMAYQLTKDKKYADRAWLDLKAVCEEFYDWHPTHDIDTGEMCAAVAIGYDWMYEAFSDEQRKIIEEGLYQKGLYEASLAYQTSSSPMSAIAYGQGNHNVVCNGGIAMASLAVMDVFPKETYFLVSCAVRAAELNIQHFAPEGAYYEGPHYWEYAMQYTSKLISSLDSSLGGAFGLECVEGLDSSADYMMHMQSSNGIFNYGDGTQAKLYVPEMLWVASKYNRPDTSSAFMKLSGTGFSGGEDLTLALLWYDSDTSVTGINLPKDKYYSTEETITLRESWSNQNGGFVGIHAGKTNLSHSQLDGASFVYDYDGIRWAIDPGAGNYNQTGYWDTGENGQRWRIFLNRAEAHNTIVVNPSLLPDHKVNSYAAVDFKASDENGAIVEVDTTELLYDVSSAKRGYMFTDNRQSLVIRDEVNLTKESDVYWFMQTKADVQIDETGATLTQNGKKLRLDFLVDGNGTIEVTKGVPLPTSPVEKNDNYGTHNRIIIKARGTDTVNITVKLTPYGISGSSIFDYDKSINQWSLIKQNIMEVIYIL
ncbi:MAG: heparinase II/III family protein [Clostridia bacterium]|nr:heparinase II/III family protein [Clostridia bacterium]